MTNASKANRISYLDSLKGFAIICVVLGHVVSNFLEAEAYPTFANCSQLLRDAIYAFHMPLFFLISGYLFSLAYIERSGAKARWNKLKWQIANLIILYVVFTFFMTVFKMQLSSYCSVPATFDTFLMAWRFPYQIHWYLYELVILYVAFALSIKHFSNKWVSLSVITICVALDTLGLPKDFEINRLVIHAPFFLLGFLIQQESFVPHWWMAAVAIVIAFFVPDTLHTFFLALGLSLLFLLAFERFSILENKVLSLGGRYCLEIFLLHTYIVACLRTVLPMIGLGYYPIALIVNTILSTAIPIGVAIMLKKIGVHEWVFRPAYKTKTILKY